MKAIALAGSRARCRRRPPPRRRGRPRGGPRTPASTLAATGFERTSVNSAGLRPASRRRPSTRSMTGSLARPGSVTTSGPLQPGSLAGAGQLADRAGAEQHRRGIVPGRGEAGEVEAQMASLAPAAKLGHSPAQGGEEGHLVAGTRLACYGREHGQGAGRRAARGQLPAGGRSSGASRGCWKKRCTRHAGRRRSRGAAGHDWPSGSARESPLEGRSEDFLRQVREFRGRFLFAEPKSVD